MGGVTYKATYCDKGEMLRICWNEKKMSKDLEKAGQPLCRPFPASALLLNWFKKEFWSWCYFCPNFVLHLPYKVMKL